jgi:hypothetical protein
MMHALSIFGVLWLLCGFAVLIRAFLEHAFFRTTFMESVVIVLLAFLAGPLILLMAAVQWIEKMVRR